MKKGKEGILRLQVVIDRLEGQSAVLMIQDREVIWPKKDLPAGIREGQVLAVTIEVDEEAAADRRERVQSLMDRLVKRTEMTEDK